MRKQLVIIAMAVLALLTAQCKKNEPKPGEKVMVPITGTVDFGGSKTEITTTGCITPVVGDKIYIYHSGQNVGYVNCTATSGQQFSCSGEIEENCLGTTCTFMYLGSGSTDAAGNSIDGNSTTISFANQTSVSVSNGKIANMNKFHVGSCTANVSEEGTVTLSMLSKMAIAYFQLKDGSGSPIANKNVTISGLSATATINKTDGNLTGSGTGNITVKTDANGSFYMALIPQSGPVEFAFIFAGYEGTRTFSNGIRECNFYSEQGLGSPLQVTLADAYVDLGLSVKWAKWNIGASSPEEYGDYYAWGEILPYYADGHSQDSPCSTWRSMTTGAGITDISNGYAWMTYSQAGSFYEWTTTPYDNNNILKSDRDAARQNWGSGWRMPTKTEFEELCNNTTSTWTDNYNNTGVKGQVFTSTKAGYTDKSIFLPAAGYRSDKELKSAGTHGYYWSSTLDINTFADKRTAHGMQFDSNSVGSGNYHSRYSGLTVRPVR